MDGWMDGWMGGWESQVKDCLQQSKIEEISQSKGAIFVWVLVFYCSYHSGMYLKYFCFHYTHLHIISGLD